MSKGVRQARPGSEWSLSMMAVELTANSYFFCELSSHLLPTYLALLLCLRAKRAFCWSLQASWVAQTVKNPLQCGRPGFDPWVGKSPGEGNRLPTPVFLPGESRGYSLAGYSPWDHEELDRTECHSHVGPFTWECSSRKGTISHWLISAQLLSESGGTVVDTGSLMAPISPSPVHITLLSPSLQ